MSEREPFTFGDTDPRDAVDADTPLAVVLERRAERQRAAAAREAR